MSHTVSHPLAERLLRTLGHAPTPGQQRAIEALQRLLTTTTPQATLVLKGYAGTGKTTLVGALVQVLRAERRPVVLLAPTGRAAKVLSAYARQSASTIHRRIYRVGEGEDGFGLSLSANRDAGALFIVDEASMIGTGGEGGLFRRDLLEDLFTHVFEHDDCRLLLIGDPAQLPPVGSAESPALDVKGLRERFGLAAGTVELTDVVRQQEDSGILANATALRALLRDPEPLPRFTLGSPDITRTTGTDLQDELESAFARFGDEEVCLITRSNKRAYQYSMQVRARIHGFEEELNAGDRLMVVKNDYYWGARNGRPELIANGELLEVLRVRDVEERYGHRFLWIEAAWYNGAERREGEVLVMLDVLALDAPALPHARRRALQEAVVQGVAVRSRAALFRMLKEDPHVNALQVKYAYAVTCHKAQGGQWRGVFVDQGYITEEMIDTEYVRWLYTAITRASEKLWLVNFHPRFFGEDEDRA
ncbi:MAG: AAA family ATPase [Flavobacteriales bacterium]|nr:AAA family ATPase [Flavobacteriales bacterium]